MTDLDVPRLRVHTLTIKNYRALQDVTFKDLTPLTVLCGANGSGKSTVFDVFAFLNEAFTFGLRPAWDRRNRMSGIRSRGTEGPVSIEIKYRTDLDGKSRLVTYRLSVDEDDGLPVVAEEKVQWTSAPGSGRPRDILNFSRGAGAIWNENQEINESEELASPDLLAVSALGQLRSHPRIKLLRDFVAGWYLSYLSADNTRTTPVAGPVRRLSQSGDNLPNVLQWLSESDHERLELIFRVLSDRVPQLEQVSSEELADGRLLLRLKDKPFAEPVLAKFASDGTLKLLSYLTVIYDPTPPAVVGIEEPENQLHPKLLRVLAEEIRDASSRCQILVTTHSPEFIDELRPQELWMMGRDDSGYAYVRRASDDKRLMEMVASGGRLGDLWNEGFLRAADPVGLR